MDSRGLTIWLGYIEDISYRRITEGIIKDVECLLIRTHKPPLNKACTEGYDRRDKLKIVNKNFPLLYENVEVSGGYIEFW